MYDSALSDPPVNCTWFQRASIRDRPCSHGWSVSTVRSPLRRFRGRSVEGLGFIDKRVRHFGAHLRLHVDGKSTDNVSNCQSSIEMSPSLPDILVRNVPFFCFGLFLLLSAVALEKFLASKPQERRSSSRSTYGIPAAGRHPALVPNSTRRSL